jgi:hypothetical protein
METPLRGEKTLDNPREIMLINIVVDLSYAALDPRIRYE